MLAGVAAHEPLAAANPQELLPAQEQPACATHAFSLACPPHPAPLHAPVPGKTCEVQDWELHWQIAVAQLSVQCTQSPCLLRPERHVMGQLPAPATALLVPAAHT